MNDSMLPGNRPSPEPAATPETGGGGGGFARSASMAVGRGTLLVGFAVLLGILLLQVVDPGPDGSGASTGTTSTTAANPGTGVTTAPGAVTTATTAATTAAGGGARTPSQVSVIVFNGSNASGVAANATAKLKAAGYKTLDPTDAQTKQVGTTSTCKANFAADTAGVVAIVGGKATPYPASPTPTAASADCFVIIGS